MVFTVYYLTDNTLNPLSVPRKNRYFDVRMSRSQLIDVFLLEPNLLEVKEGQIYRTLN